MVQDQAFIDAYSYSDEQNAKITFDTILQKKLMEHIDSNFEVFKEFNDNPEFRNFFANTLYKMMANSYQNLNTNR